MFQENKARQIFWATNISYSLIRTCAYQGGKKCSFFGKFGVLCLLETPFSDSLFWVITDELLNYKKVANLFSILTLQNNYAMFTHYHHYQCHIYFKKLPYRNTVVFKYYRIIEFGYVYQVTASLAKTGIFLRNNLHIFKLLITVL